MKKIYVCSSLGEEMQESQREAEKYAAYVMERGGLPIWPLFLLPLTDGESDEARAFIRLAGKNLLWMCDEIWVFGEMTAEMEEEIHFARQVNLSIRKIPAEEVKRLMQKKKGEM